MNNSYKQIYKVIKKYKTIVIARHIGADPDALGAQFALQSIIRRLFPEKRVLAVGSQASRFRFFGLNDKFEEQNEDDVLCVVLDTPDIKRIDGVSLSDLYSK